MVSLFDLTKHGGDRRALKGHTHNIPALRISPDNRYVASTSIDRRIIIWDIGTGKPIKTSGVDREWGWGILWASRRDMQLGVKDREESHMITRENEMLIRTLRSYLLQFEEQKSNDDIDIISDDGSDSMEDEPVRERSRSEGKVDITFPLEEDKKTDINVSRLKDNDLVLIQTTKTYMKIIDPNLRSSGQSMILKARKDLVLEEAEDGGIQRTAEVLIHSRYCLCHYIEMFGLLILGNNMGDTIHIWELCYSLK